MSTYDIGDLVRVSVAFSVDGVPTDPATVVCKVKPPGHAIVTSTYGTDVALVRESAGVYHLDVDITQHGTWRYRWQSTGNAQGAEEALFHVRGSAFS